MMEVQTAPDLFLIALLGGAIVVVAAAIFWFLGSRHPRVVVATLAAFIIAVAFGVIIQKQRMAVTSVRRAEAEARLQDLEADLQARQNRQQAERDLMSGQSRDDRLPDDRAGRQLAPAAVTSTEVSAAWRPEVDEQFEADLYPSAKLASQALIREWLAHFNKLNARDIDQPKLIRISSLSKAEDVDTLALLEAMDELVQKRFPEAGTLVTTGPGSQAGSQPKAGEIEITLTISQSVRRNRSRMSAGKPGGDVEISGFLSAAFKAPTWQFGNSSRFIEKPWLTATSEFFSLRHGTTYLVVQCSQLASSGEEASRDVLGQAANRLGHLIDPREDQGLPRAASAIMLEQLEAGKYIADRFVQKLKRPYGDVYREAILLDIGNTNLRDMIQVALSQTAEHQRATERRSTTRISGGLGLLIVLGVLTGLYLLLNWLTKGYYRGPLTVVVCMLGSGAIVSAIMFIGAIV